MNEIVVDASVAIKWVVEEPEADKALALWSMGSLIAPDLIYAECANILWKKAQRGEHTKEESLFGARLMVRADLETFPSDSLMEAAVELAIDLDHPAYDCLYLALALERDCQFVTADKRLLNKLGQSKDKRLAALALPLAHAPDVLAHDDRPKA